MNGRIVIGSKIDRGRRERTRPILAKPVRKPGSGLMVMLILLTIGGLSVVGTIEAVSSADAAYRASVGVVDTDAMREAARLSSLCEEARAVARTMIADGSMDAGDVGRLRVVAWTECRVD